MESWDYTCVLVKLPNTLHQGKEGFRTYLKKKFGRLRQNLQCMSSLNVLQTAGSKSKGHLYNHNRIL